MSFQENNSGINPIFEDNEDIDWDQIDMDMLSDRENALESYIDEYTDSEEFEDIVLKEWRKYRATSSFKDDFDDWCDTNGYEKNGDALEAMKDDWIWNWKYENEYSWSEEHRDELEEHWEKYIESSWRRQWAEIHAISHNVNVEKLLAYWNLNPIASVATDLDNKSCYEKDYSCLSHKQTEQTDIVHTEYITEKKEGGVIMSKKISVETFFNKVQGKISARLQDNKLTILCDLYTDNTEEDQYMINLDFIAYDIDDDICGRESKKMYELCNPFKMDIEAGIEPFKLIVRDR